MLHTIGNTTRDGQTNVPTNGPSTLMGPFQAQRCEESFFVDTQPHRKWAGKDTQKKYEIKIAD